MSGDTSVMEKKPNIIFILADDLGIGDISAFNPELKGMETTPTIDAIIGESVCFGQQYSSSAVCMPARATLMTGLYPQRVGTIDLAHHRPFDYMDPDVPTIAELLRTAGYRTGIVGKWHLGIGDMHPRNRGFDETVTFNAPLMDYFRWTIDYNNETKLPSDGRYITDVFTDEAIGFIERHHNEQFFLHLSFNAPHDPYQAPEEDIRPYRECGRYNESVSTLYGMVRRMDAGIGRVLKTLQRLGIDENTMILFTSDNGPVQNEEMRRYNCNLNGGKCVVYEGGIRVPMIVRWPQGIEGGRTVNDMVHFADWFPTLLSIAGADMPAEVKHDGINVLPLLQGNGNVVPVKRFWQWTRYEVVPFYNAAMRDGSWKLFCPSVGNFLLNIHTDRSGRHSLLDFSMLSNAVDFDHSGVVLPEEFGTMTDYYEYLKELSTRPKPVDAEIWPPLFRLYNLDEDPQESRDVSERHPEIVNRMRLDLENWYDEIRPYWQPHCSANPYYANDPVGARAMQQSAVL